MTLVEVMITAVTSAFVMGSLLVASVQLQRNFASHQDYTRGVTNQMLLADYLAIDLRSARSITAMADNALTVQVAPYATTALNGRGRNDPTIALITARNSRMLRAYYGATPDTSVQVRYYKNGKTIYREEAGRGTLAIADGVNFDVAYPLIADPDNAGSMVNDLTRVTVSVEWTPTLKRSGLRDVDRQTFLFNTVTLRNIGN